MYLRKSVLSLRPGYLEIDRHLLRIYILTNKNFNYVPTYTHTHTSNSNCSMHIQLYR